MKVDISRVLVCINFLVVVLDCSGDHRSARRNGDIILGALFPIHRKPHDTSRYTRSCGKIWEQYGIHRTEMFFLTLEEINNDPNILPNITLGWDIRDSCWYSPIALEQSIDFIKTSIASIDGGNRNDSLAMCGVRSKVKPIAGLIGPGSSQNTIQVQNMLQMFHIPQIGYSATSMDLSDKNLYQYFVRVVPSDKYQAQAMLDVVIRFNWTYISTVHSEGNYGERGIEVFKNLAKQANVCIAVSESAPSVENNIAFDHIVTMLLKSLNARVVVCFCEGMAARRLMEAIQRNPLSQGIGKFQIVASDGWADRPDVVANIEDIATGAITMKLMSKPIPYFDSYFRSLKPENNSRNPWFREFWQWKFKCYLPWLSLEEQDKTQTTACTGNEVITDLVQDAKLGFVVKAIYALAHALHNMQQDVCGNVTGTCEKITPVDGQTFLNYLLNVSFKFESESVFFDDSGDPPPRYYIVNYQKQHNWRRNPVYRYEIIGTWNSGELVLDNYKIYWPNITNVTRSICSEECPKGSVKKVSGNIACCWVCTPCQDNEIINSSDTCRPCELGWWPDSNQTECIKIVIAYITWWDTEGMVALITACIGISVTLWIGVVFMRHNNTPVVKASTRELMYIILLGVLTAFCSNFVLVARPSLVSCYFTRILPGLSFSLVYGSLVTKTNRIARILEGTKKIITKKPRFMSASAQVILTCILIGVECAIITIMLVIEPADSKLDYSEPRRVKLVCNTTTMGIIVPLGFDLVLIIMCTLYAVKTRNLPENFNEAKFIGFSMYTTCVIWLGFMAIYFGSDRKVITMSVSISLSAYVALILLFFPKVYIIIWAPEKNTRSAFTTSKDVRCHIGSISCASGESIDLIRDKKNDGLHVPTHRRKTFLQRLRYGGTTHRNPKHIPVPRLKREVTVAMKRDNSFHVPATSNSGNNASSFSWAKMASAGTSEEDKLSTISSKEASEEVKCKHVSFQRQDFGCQTDSELLKSILRMPYLRRRQSQRIQRSRAIDDGFATLKFSPNNSVKVSYNRNISNGASESITVPESRIRSKNGRQKKGFLRPSYPESSVSTSDDFENEEDFEYYDSISDLLKAHPVAPICVNDAAMSTYLNPLGNRNNDSIENESEGTTPQKPEDEKPKEEPHCHLVVENGTDGPNTLVVKEPLINSLPHRKSNQVGPSISTKSNSDHNLANSVANSVFKGPSQSSIISKRRASSPASPYVSCNSINTNAVIENRRPSALSQGSFCSTKEIPLLPSSTVGTKSTDDMSSDQFVDAVDKEEKSMLEFQTFLRKRGVELDMTYIESSDV